MKIALCFSGQVRTFSATYPSLRKHILSRLRGNSLYYFGCFPRDKDSHFAYDVFPFHAAVSEADEPLPGLVVTPGGHDVEARPWNQARPLSGYLRQLRSLSIADHLQQEYARQHGISFDWVLRLRFDNLYIAPLEPLEELNPTFLYVPAHDSWNGLNDRFALAPPELMSIYCSRFEDIAKYAQEGVLIHPESLLKDHLSRYGVSVRHTRVVHHLYRHGELLKARFKAEEGNDPSFIPPRPGSRWRFHIQRHIGDAAYQRLSLLWWRYGF